MIQRIQTVFLALIVIAMVSLLFLPLWSKVDAVSGEEVVLTAWDLTFQTLNAQGEATQAGTQTGTSTIAIAILAILAAGIALYEIFQYKSRINQMKFGLINTLVLVALFGTSFYYANYVGNVMASGNDGTYEAGFYMPILALLLNALANRFIKRDEDLVRSVDRLR
ncbi:DUF4293 domain-containing protein [Pontibacter sp. JH31]|uniref:DUF4293 domain-containing protein n=1 Tax=Pontibacter aquaedesilientis TaxID=2766980 RepID=A0ABR7XL02_9BACT|nr:DUF4293 domain-containing protein [Pontibacter aquaedesilientis]MBD1398958.1 DUF4293 domain-containing protein [Pontibacter aquaedesilientis]